MINDFQKWKQLEAEKRLDEEMRTITLAKQLSLSCETSQEAEEKKRREQQLEAELDGLLDQVPDPILQQYMRKRMQEMAQKVEPRQLFGHLIRCADGEQFLRAIEQDVRVICHIYSLHMKECQRLNECFQELATRQPTTKFVAVEVNSCGMSARFEEKGCPAILVYKKGSLIGSFVTVTDELGSRFDADDVQAFLVDHAFLTDSHDASLPEIVSQNRPKFRDATADQGNDDDDDSD